MVVGHLGRSGGSSEAPDQTLAALPHLVDHAPLNQLSGEEVQWLLHKHAAGKAASVDGWNPREAKQRPRPICEAAAAFFHVGYCCPKEALTIPLTADR